MDPVSDGIASAASNASLGVTHNPIRPFLIRQDILPLQEGNSNGPPSQSPDRQVSITIVTTSDPVPDEHLRLQVNVTSTIAQLRQTIAREHPQSPAPRYQRLLLDVGEYPDDEMTLQHLLYTLDGGPDAELVMYLEIMPSPTATPSTPNPDTHTSSQPRTPASISEALSQTFQGSFSASPGSSASANLIQYEVPLTQIQDVEPNDDDQLDVVPQSDHLTSSGIFKFIVVVLAPIAIALVLRRFFQRRD